MNLDSLHIGVSPITETLYVGLLNRDRNAWTSKSDCTSRFIGALMEWAPLGTVRMVTDNHGNRYEVEVRKLEKQDGI